MTPKTLWKPPPAAFARSAKGKVRSVGGKDIAQCAPDSICVHSDTPNAVAIATAVREAVKDYLRN